jgi:hypothetical protein
MASKASWEFRIYMNQYDYNNVRTAYSQEGMSKKETIWEAKRFVKNNYRDGMIVKIQTHDREKIEIYSPVNRFGEIIFTKNADV